MKAILVGFGFIGKSLVESIHRKREILRKFDEDFKLIGVSQSDGFTFNDKGLNLDKLSLVSRISEYSKDFLKGKSSIELIEEYDADLMIEATPTNIKDGEPGLTHIEKALTRGMSVVTSNKGPLVVAFKRIMSLSEKSGSQIKFDGTVAGALPVISIINDCLQGNKIHKISGILNGTANFILSKMYFEGTSFELALKEAQERGITEKDPSYDVEGIDAACKLVILANAAVNRDASFRDVKRIGINRITPEAVTLAKRSGYAIKLIGTIDKSTLEVAPKLIPETHPLCVHGTLNAIHLETDLSKEMTIIGYGAGRETISAMMNDIISLLRTKSSESV